MRRLASALLLLCCSTPAVAEEAELGRLQVERMDWSATFISQYMYIDRDDRSDDEGDFFDQYQWTANKSSSFPAELGIRDGSLDWIGAGDTPLLQVRLASPTANLGVSGSQIDEPFFNQHVDASSGMRGVSLDLRYDRIRTEQLRRFPNTAGAGLLFDDLSNPDDRFFRDRTGFAGELRVQPYLAFDRLDDPGSGLAPELSLRGGYQSRGGRVQQLTLLDPSNRWFGLTQGADRSVWDTGSSLSFTPRDDLTVSFDYDFERFRWRSERERESDLGFPPPRGDRTIGFVPDSDRSTAVVRLHSQPTPRVQLRAGVRYSELRQIDDFTPVQRAAGLDDNRVRQYAANTDLRFELKPTLDFLAAVAYDRRSNDIDRGTAAFSRSNGTQVDAFLRHFDRIVARVELHQRLARLGAATLGVSYEGIYRDLQYSTASLRILPENSWVNGDTEFINVYTRGSLLPLKGLKLFGELGYRVAPQTGYITDLDDYLYGKLRASYVVPVARPIVVTGFLRGHRGENRGFNSVSGVGPEPAGARVGRHFEQTAVAGGITISHSPIEELSLYSSFYGARNDQGADLDLSNLQRYFQDSVPITFRDAGENRFRDRQLSLVTGLNWRFADRFDTALSYSFTRAKASYGGDSSRELDLIENNHRIDSVVHGLDLEVGTWLRRGLRLLVGYRLQYFDAEDPVTESIASVVGPDRGDTFQHAFTVGLTLTSDSFSRD